MSVLVSLCLEVARAAALTVALAQPPSLDWATKGGIAVKRSDPEFVQQYLNGLVSDPEILARKRLVD